MKTLRSLFLRSAVRSARRLTPYALGLLCSVAGYVHAAEVTVLPAAPGGTLVYAVTQPFAASGLSGSFRHAIYDGPEAGVNLDFYWQVTLDPASAPLAIMSAGDPVAFPATTGLFQIAGPFGIFTAGTRSPSFGRFGSPPLEVDFAFTLAGEVQPGETTTTLIARTSAQEYFPLAVVALSGRTGTANVRLPLPAIPETSSLALLSVGLLVLTTQRRRWKKLGSAKIVRPDERERGHRA